MVQGGQPMPDEGVTHTLIELGWIYPATEQQAAAAIAEHGRPPEGRLEVGWDYVKGAAPKKAPPKKAAKKTATAKR